MKIPSIVKLSFCCIVVGQQVIIIGWHLATAECWRDNEPLTLWRWVVITYHWVVV